MNAPETANRSTIDVKRRLLDLQSELSQCTDFGDACALLASELGALLPVNDRVSIALLEPDGQWLRIHRLLPVAPASASPPRVRAENTPLSQTVRDGVSRIVADVRTDPNITFGPVSHDGIRSTITVPLWIDGRIVGAMNAGSRTVGACDADAVARLEEVAAAIGPLFVAAEQGTQPRIEAPAPKHRAVDLIGASAPFRSMLGIARRAAVSDAEVLITGETGVGKTALARAMHAWSGRRGPFVTVHLGDLTPTLVESELFGYERGAFTGASASRIGRFESAQGGTIFLDEIGETPPAIQAKILRVIQDRCLERVGGTRTIDIDVRVIAATSRDLLDESRRGLFRQDLYYRLGVVPLRVPALRERTDDLAPLVTSILARLGRDGRALTLAPAAWAKLRAYAWPGNIRELESVLRRAAILEDGSELALTDFDAVTECLPAVLAAPAEPAPELRLETLDEHERAYIEHVLARCGGVIEGATGAARILGVPPSTLRSRMKRLGIEKDAGKGRVIS